MSFGNGITGLALGAITILLGNNVRLTYDVITGTHLGTTIIIMGFFVLIASFLQIGIEIHRSRTEPSFEERLDVIASKLITIDKNIKEKRKEFREQFQSEEEYNWIIEGRRKRGIKRDW